MNYNQYINSIMANRMRKVAATKEELDAIDADLGFEEPVDPSKIELQPLEESIEPATEPSEEEKMEEILRTQAGPRFLDGFKPGWTNAATGLLGALVGGYVGNRYAGTKGMIAGGLGGGALGYTGASAIRGLINNRRRRALAEETRDMHRLHEAAHELGFQLPDDNVPIDYALAAGVSIPTSLNDGPLTSGIRSQYEALRANAAARKKPNFINSGLRDNNVIGAL